MHGLLEKRLSRIPGPSSSSAERVKFACYGDSLEPIRCIGVHDRRLLALLPQHPCLDL